ncbi:uncharacterized protein [Fopius arisanus]|uniref:Selenoprotein P N-terminal domain-containing protein n=1 Tax=Fopius arisanus TaxID=64838 RepID=A0A9R1SX33_9HYME|nr:PREDICTED: uncharacterized protein LOC105263888 [Fopius arisanus]
MMKLIFVATVMLLGLVMSEELSYEFSRVRKRQNADSFEQCTPVKFLMGQLGVVNVIAFLDNSWPYSHKQASMLKLLKDRLERSGLPEALFFVITSNSPENPFEDISEEEIEREAWDGVAPEEAMELSSGLFPPEPLEKTLSPDIFLVEDSEELGIWKELHGSRDQILVIDRCGKLAYQVIVPWSILHFPYVKAAILSTHKDDPCGPCDAYATVVELENTLAGVTDVNTETVTISPELIPENVFPPEEVVEELVLPSLRIIMHAPHYHPGSEKLNEYVVLNADKAVYHGHLEEETSEMTIKPSELASLVFESDESPGLYGEVADFWRDGGEEKIDEIVSSGDGGSGIIPPAPGDLMDEAVTSVAEFTVEEEASRSRLIAHYSKLLPWIYYILDE